MDWSVVFEYLPKLLDGLGMTFKLVLTALLLGFIVALPMAILRLQKSPWIWSIPYAYIFFFRGTPLLVQIFLIYYGASQFEWIKQSALWVVLKEPFWCAIIAFGMNTGAYTAEILRGALQNIPAGEKEAAKALGFGPVGIYRHILLPRAFRLMIPMYGNEVILMIKGSALASTITLLDLTGMARTIIARTYTPIEIFTAAGIIYLALSLVMVNVFHFLEKRYRVKTH